MTQVPDAPLTMPRANTPEIHHLAAAAGIERHWRDVDGNDQTTTDDALGAVLNALGYETGTSRQIEDSLARIAEEEHGIPPMLVTEAGLPTPLDTKSAFAEITGEDGATHRVAIENGVLGPVALPGYFDMKVGRRSISLAVAPRQCPWPAQDTPRMWGTSVQIPALRGTSRRAFGGFGELAAAGEALGAAGCDAIAINPVHALFPGTGEDYSPYSPSSRIFLNASMADPALLGLAELPPESSDGLIDWPAALPQRLAELRDVFAGLDSEMRARIAADNQREGGALRRHALFDALDCHFRPGGTKGWRDWPAKFQDPNGSAVERFAADNSEEVEFHLFAQWLARESLAVAHTRSCAAGMDIGLITDLAVGVHLAGSDTWSMRDAMLQGLTIGAPPDPLGPLGQNWCITGFSPQGLRASGYRPFIDMIRSALRSAGGLRIDHAFGLARLWVIPEGEPSSSGAYLTYPFLDLMRLVTLEAHRANALIIAEDLGTSPSGFTQAMTDRKMLGMRVLWFERAEDDGYIGAHDYPVNSVAMTGTHDTPTVAGWWAARDLDWAAKLDRLPEGTDRAKAEEQRDWDRGLLWSTLTGSNDRPAPGDTAPVVDAAVDHIARSSSILAIAPLEDLLGEMEQPNLPGTTHEHPNWQRRLEEPLADSIRKPEAHRRVRALSER